MTETSSSRSPLVVFGKLLLAALSVFIVGPFKLAKALNKRVYKSWQEGGWHALWAFLSSSAAAAAFYRFVANGGELGFPLFGANAFFATPHPDTAWGFALLAFAFVAIYGYAIAWLAIVQWFWRAWSDYYKATSRFFSKNSAGDGRYEPNGARVAGALTAPFRWFPGASALWDKVVKQQETSFIIGLQALLVALGLFWAFGKSAWFAYSLIHGAVAHTLVGALIGVLGAVVALFAAGLVAYPLYKLLRTGKAYALGLVASAFASYFVCAGVVAGTTAWLEWVAPALTVALVNAYAYPGVTILLGNDFLKKLYKRIEPIFTKFYDDRTNGFRELCQQILSIIVTASLVYGLWLVSAVSQFPHWLVISWYVGLPLAAFAAYSLIGELLDWSGGNYVIGALGSLAVAVLTFTHLGGFGDGWQHALFVAIPSGVLSWLFTFFVALPVFYVAAKWVLNLPPIGPVTNRAGELLHAAHKQAWKLFDKLYRLEERLYSKTYKDETDFRKLMNHICNILVAVLATGFVCHVSVDAHAASWATSLYATGTLLLTYLFGKKLVFRSNVRQIGYFSAIVKVILITALVKGATPFGLWFALPLAAVSASFVYFVAFPAFYLLCQAVLDPWFTALSLPAFDALYGFISDRFGFVVTWLEKLYKFLAPYFAWFIGLVQAGWQFLVDTWNSIFGRAS